MTQMDGLNLWDTNRVAIVEYDYWYRPKRIGEIFLANFVGYSDREVGHFFK